MTTRSKGTGLGLAIVNRIMEDHDGDLRLLDRDDEGRGAVVVLRFPFPKSEINEAKSKANNKAKNKEISA